MVFKSINRLAPQNLSDFFVTNSTNPSYNLRSITVDLKLPKKTPQLARKDIRSGILRFGTANHINQNEPIATLPLNSLSTQLGTRFLTFLLVIAIKIFFTIFIVYLILFNLS